jgi:hypothetical protein
MSDVRGRQPGDRDPSAPSTGARQSEPGERDPAGPVMEPALERLGRRLGHSAGWFLAIAVPLLVIGIVLIAVVNTTWAIAFGALAILLSSIPGTIGVGLLVSALISRWAARHRSFA